MEILICVLLMVSFVDILCYRIPNLWIGVGMAAGLIITAIQGGIPAVLQSLVQAVFIFIVCWPFYSVKGLGAGDVKLFMMLGCYMQGARLFYCLFLSFLIAGAWAVIKMIFCHEGRKSVIRLSVPVLCSTLLFIGGL